MDLSKALDEVYAQTKAAYCSSLHSDTDKTDDHRHLTITLRLLCGTLQSLQLLVGELDWPDGETSSQNLFLSPDRYVLGTATATLAELRQHQNDIQADARILAILRKILDRLRTAAENDSLHALMLSLSSAGMPELRPKPCSAYNIQDDDSLSDARACLGELLGEVAASKPKEYHAHMLYVRERNVTHPSYASSALRLPQFAEKYWNELQPDLQRLFDPKKTANFEHWVLEYARQQWPQHFDVDSRALWTKPLIDLMCNVSSPSLRTLHVAAALGLPSLCQWLMSEADRDAVKEKSPFGMACYCALIGPTALLARIDGPMQLAVDMIPSAHQAQTIAMLLNSFREADPETVGPGEYFSMVTMAFIVCHSLQDSGLFVEMALVVDKTFRRLFEGDAGIDQYWPEQLPKLSQSFLEQVLPHLLDTSIKKSENYDELHSVVRAIYDIIDRHKLKCTETGPGTWPLDITDDRYITTVHDAVQNFDLKVLRRLIQDPRWDPNAFIIDETTASTSDGGDVQSWPIKGTTLLHFAVESNKFNLAEMILRYSRKSVDVHARNINDQTPLMLSESPEMLKILLDHGARTTDTDDCGRNVWHLAAANSDIPLIDCLNEHDEYRDQNLRGLMKAGRTPIAEAVIYPFKQMRKQSRSDARPPYCALHMLEICKKDPDYLQSPTPLLHIAAAWGSEPLASKLIEFGVDTSLVDDTGRSALHWMNASATPKLVQTLQKACRARLQTHGGLTPADTILDLAEIILDDEAEIASSPTTDEDVNPPAEEYEIIRSGAFRLLLTDDVLSSYDTAGAGLWERFATNVIPRWRKLGFSVRAAATTLQDVGAMDRYENEHQKCALIPVVEAFIANPIIQRNSRRYLEKIMVVALEKSGQAATFTQSLEAVRCLKLAIQQEYDTLADKLLKLGVPVQKRCNGTSLLEYVCQPYTTCSSTMLIKMLDHADPSRINEVDEKGIGLLRRLQDRRVANQIDKLKVFLENGLNPNSTTLVSKEPLLFGFIEDCQAVATSIMFDHGANPTATNSHGLNAVHVAASRGYISILEMVHALDGEHDWTTRCTYRYRSQEIKSQDDVFARGCTALHMAAGEGHWTVIPFLLTAFEQDVNATTLHKHWTPLHYASLHYQGDCVRALLEHGADPFARDFQGITPLILAIRHHMMDPVRVFLELRPKDDKGWAYLTDGFATAVKAGFQDIIDLFKPLVFSQTSALSNLFSKGGGKGPRETAGAVLETAIKEGHTSACQRILAMAKPSAFDSIRLTCGKCSPVIFALKQKRFEICRMLLDAGMRSCCVASRCHRHFSKPRHFNNGPCHALHIATWRLDEELPPGAGGVITKLLSSFEWQLWALSPMHSVAMSSGTSGARLIINDIRANPRRFMEILRRPGVSPHTAIKHDNHEGSPNPNGSQTYSESLVKAIIKEVVNQRVESDDFMPFFKQNATPLLIAVAEESLEMVRFLIRHGADPDAPDDIKANTPLHAAALNNLVEIARCLLEAGANHNHRNTSSSTPLATAVVAGNLETAKLLVEYGADVNAADADGMGLLSKCGKKSQRPEMFAWLLGLGLDPYQQDKSRYTPIHDTILSNGFPGMMFNYGFDFWQIRDVGKGFLSVIIDVNPGTANDVLVRLLKRLPRERAAEMINCRPGAFVSPLCNAVRVGELTCVSTLLAHGAEVDAEGAAEGSALMVACSMGRAEAVELLVRRGAKMAYRSTSGGRPGLVMRAVECAKPFPKIVRWLLVGRHTSQGKLESIDAANWREGEEEAVVKRWSGVYVGAYEMPEVGSQTRRREGESSLSYAGRLERIRQRLRGTAVRIVELWCREEK